MHRDRMVCAWSKWREAEDLFYEGLISRDELAEERARLFRGIGKMPHCEKAWKWQREELQEREED